MVVILLIALFTYFASPYLLLLLPGVVWLYFRAAKHRDYWKKRGIPGPPPRLLIGNTLEVTEKETPAAFRYREWTKVYGKTYGFIDGWQKVLITSDPKILQDVFVNKFESFHTRRVMPTVVDSIHTMIDELERRHVGPGKPVDILKFYQEFTLDVIMRVALGQNGTMMFHNPLLQFVRNFFARSPRNFGPMLGRLVPPQFHGPLRALILRIRRNVRPLQELREQVNKAVAERKEKKVGFIFQQRTFKANEKSGEESKATDFIDLFLDAEADVDLLAEGALGTKTHIERKLSEGEIFANLFLFLIAGYDTTANSLAYASFYIARDESVRRRLQEEIDSVCVDEVISYEQTQSLRYMDSVVREALRLHPLASAANARACTSDTTVGDGVHIEKDVRVVADTYSLHYSKDIWGDDAEEFRPERWGSLEHRDPINWLPFGIGPRICLGMRLGLLEEKLVLAYLLRKFDIITCEQSETKLSCHGALTVAPDSVTVALRKRKTG